MNKFKYGTAAIMLSLAMAGQAIAAETVRVRIAEYSSKTKAHFTELADKFNASQSDIKVVLETIPWPEMQQQLITDISAGTAPDISHMATRWMSGFAADGVLAPIEDLVSDDFAARFVPTYLDLQKKDGHTWGLPIAASARGLFVNKDILAKAGVDTAPTTWDETFEAAKKISALGDDIYGLGIQGNNQDVEGYWFYSLWTHGGELITADGKSGLASDAAIAATNNYIRFIEAGLTQPGVAGSSREDLQNLFTAGKLGMVLTGPWFNAQLAEEAPDLPYGISSVPIATTPATYGVTDTIAIMESSKVKKEAAAFLEYMFSDENRLEFGKLEGFVPVLKSMSTEPYFSENPNMTVFLEMGSVAKFAPLAQNWEEMAEALSSALSNSYSGDKPVAESLQAAAAKMDELLAE